MDYGIVVDLETTGFNPDEDRIIELGILEFAVDQSLTPVITGMYGGLEDPGQPLKPEIKKLTGLNDDVLAGQKIHWDIARQYFERASIVIAHNCAFDRSFLLKRPELDLEDVQWGCSIRHIDWEAKGFKSRALTYLAADHGFVNPFAHRALFDCAATFRLIAPYLQELTENSYRKEYRINARYAAFETKDKLKQRGYHWDSEGRVWFKVVLDNVLENERGFLASEIYNGAPRHEEFLLEL